MLDMAIEPSLVCGFYVLVRHGDEGPSTQIKLLRVWGITTDTRGDPSSMKQISNVVIPKCKHGSELFYEFPTATFANIISFEFVSNYGGVELCTPQIRITKYQQ
jgi:hypothetical protein